MAASFPRQDIPESQKDLTFCKKVLEYAIRTINDQGQGNRLNKMKYLRNAYNGILDNSKVKYLTETYGKRIKTKFVKYRLSRPKIDLVNGEFLKRKLTSDVRSENRDAKSQKLEKLYTAIGIRESQPQIQKLQEIAGFDALQGMDIPQTPEGEQNSKINIKTQNEKYMSYVLKHFLKKKNLKKDLARNFMDLEQVAECHGRVSIKRNLSVEYETIMPEDAIFVESYADDNCSTSPIRGHRKWMFIHDILNEYELTKEERDMLDNMRGEASELTNQTYNGRRLYRMIGDDLAIEVIRVEWFSSRPDHTKVYPNGKRVDISPEYIEKNRSKVKNDQKNGKYKIETAYKKEIWEATQIGHKIYKDCQRLPNQMRSVDAPHDPQSTYISHLFNTIDGTRVSLQEMMENIDFLFDVTMYQINREIGKAKGKVVAYDEAYLPRGKKMKDVMHHLADDGLYIYNSAQEGNQIQRDVVVSGQIKEIDLGLSNNIQHLIALKLDLQDMADRLSGIPQDREGQISASSTVTNAQSNIVASRTITEPMFFAMEGFAQEVMGKILESVKVAVGIMGSKELDLIIGDDGVSFFKATKDLANDDYAAYIVDGRQEQLIREALDQMAQVSVNAKELRIQDWLKTRLAETLVEAEEALIKGWNEMEAARQRSDELRSQSQTEKIEAQKQMAIEDREDRQAHEIILKQMDIGGKGMVQTAKDEAQLMREQSKIEQTPESPRRNQ